MRYTFHVAAVLVLIELLPARVATAGQVADFCKLMDAVVADGFDGVTDATVEYALCSSIKARCTQAGEGLMREFKRRFPTRDPKSIILADCSDLRR
jgi:hypothetical protein